MSRHCLISISPGKVLQGMLGPGVYLGIKQSIPHRKTVPLFVEPDLGSKCKANSDDDNLGQKGGNTVTIVATLFDTNWYLDATVKPS